MVRAAAALERGVGALRDFKRHVHDIVVKAAATYVAVLNFAWKHGMEGLIPSFFASLQELRDWYVQCTTIFTIG